MKLATTRYRPDAKQALSSPWPTLLSVAFDWVVARSLSVWSKLSQKARQRQPDLCYLFLHSGSGFGRSVGPAGKRARALPCRALPFLLALTLCQCAAGRLRELFVWRPGCIWLRLPSRAGRTSCVSPAIESLVQGLIWRSQSIYAFASMGSEDWLYPICFLFACYRYLCPGVLTAAVMVPHCCLSLSRHLCLLSHLRWMKSKAQNCEPWSFQKQG